MSMESSTGQVYPLFEISNSLSLVKGCQVIGQQNMFNISDPCDLDLWHAYLKINTDCQQVKPHQYFIVLSQSLI